MHDPTSTTSEEAVAVNDVVELTVQECLELLETTTVGRVGLVTEAGIRIFPVNYTVFADNIVFRTTPYGAIADSAHGAEVAFEVDALDHEAHAGWSVLAVGRCERIEDPATVRLIRSERDVEPWAAGQRILYFTIAWTDLTGRRLGARRG
jgi:nitroimidazol reductase NimA-like FMN-containing flavoprotein (pyridoxamine 5'-phosphate oxidase superfamily)